MARQGREKEIESGILSVGTVGDFLGISAETVKKLCANGKIKANNISTTGRKEWRIPATLFEKYCLENDFPIHKRLRVAAANFRVNFATEAYGDLI